MNCGVHLKGDYGEGEKDYYGVLREILKVSYVSDPRLSRISIVVFKCDWFDTTGNRGTRENKALGLVEVHKRGLRSIANDCFIMAHQASQVFYTVASLKTEVNWLTVSRAKARHTFDIDVEDFAFQEEGNDMTTHVRVTEDDDEIEIVHLINNRPVLEAASNDQEMDENEDEILDDDDGRWA